MKIETDHSGVPYNFDVIPNWILPEMYDKKKAMPFRGLWFVLLYALSTTIFGGLLFIPLALFSGKWAVPLVLWSIFGFGGGALIGFAKWWDFSRKY